MRQSCRFSQHKDNSREPSFGRQPALSRPGLTVLSFTLPNAVAGACYAGVTLPVPNSLLRMFQKSSAGGAMRGPTTRNMNDIGKPVLRTGALIAWRRYENTNHVFRSTNVRQSISTTPISATRRNRCAVATDRAATSQYPGHSVPAKGKQPVDARWAPLPRTDEAMGFRFREESAV